MPGCHRGIGPARAETVTRRRTSPLPFRATRPSFPRQIKRALALTEPPRTRTAFSLPVRPPSSASARTPPPNNPRRGERESGSGGRAPLYFYPPAALTDADARTHATKAAHSPRNKMQRPQQHQAPPPPHRHAKTDSEVTSSMAPSSPSRAAYYVQSPSHDDGENKTAASSFHSSPAASPPRSLGRASRDSSSSRFSASAKGPSSRAGAANGNGAAPAAAAGRGRGRGGGGAPWMKEAAIEEEGLLGMDDDGDDYGSGGAGGWSGIPKRVRYGILFVGSFFGLFFFFALILWGASRNQRPVVTLHSVTFHRFVVQAGTDASLVPTEMSSLNATVKLTFRNTGTFFGVHVSSDPVTLYYTQLQLASGNVSLQLIPSFLCLVRSPSSSSRS